MQKSTIWSFFNNKCDIESQKELEKGEGEAEDLVGCGGGRESRGRAGDEVQKWGKEGWGERVEWCSPFLYGSWW